MLPEERRAADPVLRVAADERRGISQLDANDIQEQLLRRNVKRSRGGLVFKAHFFVYHSTLGLRVIKKKKKEREEGDQSWV